MSLSRIEALLKEELGMETGAIGAAALAQIVRRRMEACGAASPEAYWEHLQGRPQELAELKEAVVVLETWFFRDAETWSALAEVARGWLAAPRPRRILSAPCSTGEEPYSIAIALLAAGLPAEQFRVDALDVSERALQAARRAVYGRNSFRSEMDPGRAAYFRDVPEGREVISAVRRRVRFRPGNLLAGPPGTPGYDLLFCRNVLIYFDAATQAKVLDHLRASLAPDGLLFVGAAEAFLTHAHGFVSAGFTGAFTLPRPAAPVAKRVAPRPVPRPAPPRPAPARQPPPPATAPVAPPGLEEIERLADAGKLEEARAACRTWLATHETSAAGHYLLGVLHDSAHDPSAAREAYRHALYLEPGHPEALRHLALLTEKRGDAAGARRLQRRARRSEEAAAS